LPACPEDASVSGQSILVLGSVTRHTWVFLPVSVPLLSFLQNPSPSPRNQDTELPFPAYYSLFTIYCSLSFPLHYPLFSLSVIPAQAGIHNPIYLLLATHYCPLSSCLTATVYSLRSFSVLLDACFRRHDTVVLVFPFSASLCHSCKIHPLYQGTRITRKPICHSPFTVYYPAP